jgi:hypothetical protein
MSAESLQQVLPWMFTKHAGEGVGVGERRGRGLRETDGRGERETVGRGERETDGRAERETDGRAERETDGRAERVGVGVGRGRHWAWPLRGTQRVLRGQVEKMQGSTHETNESPSTLHWRLPQTPRAHTFPGVVSERGLQNAV